MRRCLCGDDNNNTNPSAVLNLTTTTPRTGCCNRDEALLDNLCRFIGSRCICEFVFHNSKEREEITGVLEAVGCDYITLCSVNNGRRTICNTDNLAFITIL